MRNVLRFEIVPMDREDLMKEMAERAKKCGLIIEKIQDFTMEGYNCKEFIFAGTRFGFIRYWGEDILRGNVPIKKLPGMLKLMFLK